MPAEDTFGPRLIEQLIGVTNASEVTPSDTIDLANVTRALYVGVAGAVKVTLKLGGTATFSNLASGVFHPLRVTRVWATGTTATGIVACF